MKTIRLAALLLAAILLAPWPAAAQTRVITTCGTLASPLPLGSTGQPLFMDITGTLCTSSTGGGGGGGAITAASGSYAAGALSSGSMVDLGAIADAAATAGGTGTLSAKLRLMTTQLGTLNTSLGTINTTLGTPLQAGGGVAATLAAETTKVIGTIRIASGGVAAGGLASGASVDLGAQADSACATDNGTCSEIALIKRANQRLTTFGGTVSTWAGGTLGAMAAYGTSPGAVLVPGANVFVTNSNDNLATNVDGIAAVASNAVGAGSPVNSKNYVWNGSTWDRMPGSTAGLTVKAASGGFASGSMVDVGAQADSVCSTDTGTCTLIALTKRNNARLTTLNTSIGAANAYETVAASATAQVLGGSGAAGDYLSHCIATPGTTSPGVVTILDNATAIVSFAGGASSVSNLVPFTLPIGSVSSSGAWKITTGTNITVVCVGRFT